MRTRVRIWMAVLLAMALAQSAPAADPLKVTIEPMTFQVSVAEGTARGRIEPGSGFYPIRNTTKVVQRKVDVVKLDNGLVEAWVVPAWAGRLLRAIDKKTGVDYFRWGDTVEGHLPWGLPGGVKPSFPFFEHGTHLEQPAGYRIVKHDDGAVTVAMDMRFTQYTGRAENGRYGRFCDEALNIMVTLKPGSTVVYWRQRKENPNPLPRAERMWNDVFHPVARPTKTVQETDKKTGQIVEKTVEDRDQMKKLTRFIYPARWVSDHGPTTIHTSPHWTNPDNWDVSHFAIDAPYYFVGTYDVPNRVSRLRINDEQGPAAKLYTCFWADFCEHWGGVGYVFEKPGKLRPAYEPVEFTHRFWIAQGMGEVSYANDDVAVSVDGANFELAASRNMDVRVTDGSGKAVARGPVGPHTILRGQFDGTKLAVAEGEKVLMSQTFPLDRPVPGKDTQVPPEVRARFNAILASVNLEGETVARNEGTQGALMGIATNPRIAYRFGQFDQAMKLLTNDRSPDADYLRGLMRWEQGLPVDFGTAGWQADYMRALLAVRIGDKQRAIERVDGYLKNVPNAWYPRLARAYWRGDKAAARTLADENPGSPEAQLVLKLLGEEHELDALLENNPQADTHVANFEGQITKGTWSHLPRYPVPARGP